MPALPPFLGVKNAHRLHHYKDRTAPWIRLYVDLLKDPKFLALAAPQRGYYMTLYLLAGVRNNRIPSEGLKQLMGLDHEPDLSPLFSAGFLLASHASKLASKSATTPSHYVNNDDGMQIDLNLNLTPNPEDLKSNAKKERIGKERIGKERKPLTLTDEEFLAFLRASPAYQHFSVDVELAKLDAWLLTHPREFKTRRRIVNWLNNVPAPMGQRVPVKPPEMGAPQRRMLEREAELRRLKAEKEAGK